jgi:adenosine kinase
MQMLLDKTGMSPAEVASQVEALIITRGGEGAEIVTQDKNIMIPVVAAKEINDPTGCGDAFRSGLLYGLMNDLGWEITGRIASLLGSIKIEQHGTQNHSFTMDEFKARFQSEFDMTF